MYNLPTGTQGGSITPQDTHTVQMMCRTEEKTHSTMHTVFCRYRDTRRDVCCNAHTHQGPQETTTQAQPCSTHTHSTDSQKHQEALNLQSHTPSTRDTRMDMPRHLHAGGVYRQTGTPCNTYTHYQIHLTMRHIPYKLHTSPGTEIHRDSHTKKHTAHNKQKHRKREPACSSHAAHQTQLHAETGPHSETRAHADRQRGEFCTCTACLQTHNPPTLRHEPYGDFPEPHAHIGAQEKQQRLGDAPLLLCSEKWLALKDHFALSLPDAPCLPASRETQAPPFLADVPHQ